MDVGTILIPGQAAGRCSARPTTAAACPPDRFGPPLALIVTDATGQIVFDSRQRRVGEHAEPDRT